MDRPALVEISITEKAGDRNERYNGNYRYLNDVCLFVYGMISFIAILVVMENVESEEHVALSIIGIVIVGIIVLVCCIDIMTMVRKKKPRDEGQYRNGDFYDDLCIYRLMCCHSYSCPGPSDDEYGTGCCACGGCGEGGGERCGEGDDWD